jgi:glutaryl-CoA dehydrogenase
VDAMELLALDDLLSDEERALREVVRRVVAEHVRPHVARWFEVGTAPTRELARRFGEVGLLGMHLTGYGCAGTSAVSYGLACLELEAGDSGMRSLVSVQGSLAMYAIWRYGSESQKSEWLPSMATGERIGCFGLTEPDHGSDPASMSTRAVRDGDDWILHGTKMWITNAPVADVAVVWARTDDGVRGFLVPIPSAGVSVREVEHKLSLRASSTSSSARSGRPATACRRPSPTPPAASSSAGRSRGSSSPRPSWPTWRSSCKRDSCSPCILAGWPTRVASNRRR